MLYSVWNYWLVGPNCQCRALLASLFPVRSPAGWIHHQFHLDSASASLVPPPLSSETSTWPNQPTAPNPNPTCLPPRAFSRRRMGPSTAGDACASSSSGPSTSAFAAGADAGATHYLAKRVLRGSAVLHVAEGCFRSPDFVDVVLGKVPLSDPVSSLNATRIVLDL